MHSRVRIFGDKLRYKYLDAPDNLTKALAFDGTFRTELKELGQDAQVLIRRTDQMAGMGPLDPRQVAVYYKIERRDAWLLDQAMTHAYGRRDALVIARWTKRVKDVRLMERQIGRAHV